MLNESYAKRILLSVTGMSPAVVMETLYALVTTEKPFIPTEIKVITTLQGKNKLLEGLLGIVAGRKERTGALHEFISDYGEKYGFNHIHFDENSIEVIEDSQHNQLSDIRSPEENELSANQIVKLVGNLCKDENCALHVSIAGGRKTMGFFLGYALSLYGRKQDSLSHVLVSAEFENLRDFYYPKPYSHTIIDNQGNALDASQGKVMLAEIPWVRLGLGVPDDLIQNAISYSDSVNKAQQILDEPTLHFLAPMEKREVLFGENKIKLSHRGYALLLSLVVAKKQGWDFNVISEVEKVSATYLAIYEEIKIGQDLRENLGDFNQDVLKFIEKFKSTLSDSRQDIVKKVKKAFSIGKSNNTPYIPYSSDERYSLDIAEDNLDISEIEVELNSQF